MALSTSFQIPQTVAGTIAAMYIDKLTDSSLCPSLWYVSLFLVVTHTAKLQLNRDE